tara:strand:+ start:4100 stop:6250 length:2151 start_codon:yes stop_codon:yes gene_type:complete
MLKTLLYSVIAFVVLFKFQANAQIQSVYAESAPKIDGVLDDDIWQNSATVTGFKTFVPDYGQDMPFKTIVYMAHDDENLYFAFKSFDDPTKIKTSIAARDKIRDDDWVCINLDSFNGQQSMYGFYINPNGIQMDTRFAAGKEDIGIDMIWYSEATINEDNYTVEVRIPFKSIRYAVKDGKVDMGVIFERKISRFSMQGTFPAMDPKQGMSFLTQTLPLSYTGVKKSVLLEVLPAITYAQSQSHQNGEYVKENNFEPSLTLKYGITSELVLDATINPDFSQVEADASQVEVNQRFPVNYPERRPFFLEGNENFNFAGNSLFGPVRSVVNTRSIVSPIAATKLTGKLGQRNIFSTIYAVDRANETLADYEEDKTAEVGVLRYMRSFSQDSYLGFIGTGRKRNDGFNAVYGVDGQVRIKQSNLFGAHILNSLTKETADGAIENKGTAAFSFQRSTRNFSGSLAFVDIGDGFRSDVGYVTRTAIRKWTLSASPKIYPKQGVVKRIDPTIYTSLTKDKPSGMYEGSVYLSLSATLPRNTRLSITSDFSTEIYQAQRFNDGGVSLSASSQITKRVYFRSSYGWDKGIYYSTPAQGYGKRISNSLNLQLSDKFNAEFNHSFNSLYNEETDDKYYDIHILRGKVIYQMNQYLFFRTIVQYNSLSKVVAPNFLASFTYIPGTVVHLGYGSIHEQTRWDGVNYRPDDQYLRTNSGFFFKASYLWRL